MGELTLFDNLPSNAVLADGENDLTDKLAGSGGGSYKRISIKGSKFRMIENGEQVAVNKNDSMEIIVVAASPVVRQYFEGSYDPKAEKATPPRCWSDDSNSRVPSKNVPEEDRMSDSCETCPMNVKGSGQGNSRACRFSQRLAVVLPGELTEVYQLSLPATSLFGEAERGMYPMQGYARLLKSHRTKISAIVTEMSFDDESETPKLFFKPLRPLTEEEYATVEPITHSEEAKQAVTLTVSQTDGVQALPEPESAPAKAPKAKKKAPPKVEEPEEEEDEVAKLKRQLAEAEAKANAAKDDVPEPSKVESSKPVEEKGEQGDKLASILDGWDDEDDED